LLHIFFVQQQIDRTFVQCLMGSGYHKDISYAHSMRILMGME
jgi:hypothetical protein